MVARRQAAFQIDYICKMHLAKQFTHPVIFRMPQYKRSPKGETSHIPHHLSVWFIWRYADTGTTK